MTGSRKRYSADFKAKVALEALRGEQTVAQLAAKHGVHQTMINAWKKQAVEGMASVFSGKAEAADAAREGEIDQLRAKIGQLVVERDFCVGPPGAERGARRGRISRPKAGPLEARQCSGSPQVLDRSGADRTIGAAAEELSRKLRGGGNAVHK